MIEPPLVYLPRRLGFFSRSPYDISFGFDGHILSPPTSPVDRPDQPPELDLAVIRLRVSVDLLGVVCTFLRPSDQPLSSDPTADVMPRFFRHYSRSLRTITLATVVPQVCCYR